MNWIHEIEQMTLQKIVTYELLPGGLTNTNYVVTFANHSQGVVRVPSDHNRSLFDYPNEGRIIDLIQPLKIDVPTLYFNTTTGIKLTLYMNAATTFQDTTSWTLERLELLAHHLRHLHQMRPAHIRAFNLVEKLITYQSEIRTSLHSFDWTSIQAHLSALYQRYPLVLCHNDVVPGNILCTKEHLYLIDYEYAGLNIYLFDVASFLNENNLDYDQAYTRHFLASYWQHEPTESELHDLLIMDEIQCYLWHEWANRQYDLTHDTVYLEIAQLKHDRYHKLINQNKKG
jgi:thiamine kinase-like enzyme